MPGRFRFRLEAVRRVRRQAQDAQQRVVAGEQRELLRLEENVRQCTEQLRAQVQAGRRTLLGTALDVPLLRRQQFYRGWLQRQILETQATADAQQAKLAREREKLAELSRRLKVIEKLREKQWLRHRTEAQRAEQVETNEIGNQMYVRQRVEGPGSLSLGD
ncbi:MAG TPA: hypothetical protein PKK06_04465 [Phycisphaerae bacterium]|nr:hypothetical protein [Phycisphaerae bacterium]HNU46157.1 hypothetical protein [Phycisphaerae bacterium]